MLTLSKAAKLRAVEDDLPFELYPGLVPAYINNQDIGDIAHEALFGRSRKEQEEEGDGMASFGGINRYIFVGVNNAFIDPAGSLMHGIMKVLRQLRRARGADPVAFRVRPKTAKQKRATQQAKPEPQGS